MKKIADFRFPILEIRKWEFCYFAEEDGYKKVSGENVPSECLLKKDTVK